MMADLRTPPRIGHRSDKLGIGRHGEESGEHIAAAGKGRVRDRIFDTACELKDALVAEYLHQQERKYWAWWDAAVARAMGARQPEHLGDALLLLLDSGYFTRLVFPLGSGPISSALPAVRALIDAYAPGVRN